MGKRLLPNSFSGSEAVFRTARARMPGADYSFSHLYRALAIPVLISFTYYLGATVGFVLKPPGSPISAFWPPNAILLAVLLLTPIRMWWVVLVAVLPAHLLVKHQHGTAIAESLGWFIGSTGEAFLGAACIIAFKKSKPLFDSVHGLVVFLVFGVLLAPLLASFVDAAVVVAAGGKSYWLLGAGRLFSNMLAELTLVPTIFIFASTKLASLKNRRRVVEAWLLAVGIAFVSDLTFGGTPAPHNVPGLVYALLPFLLWAAVRFGSSGISASLLGISLISIWNTMHSRGPFTSDSMATDLLSLNILLCTIAVPLMLLATVMMERRATEDSLRRSKTALQKRLVLEQSIHVLSHRLGDISSEQLEDEVEKGLQYTLQAAGADCVCWYVKKAGSSELVRRFSVSAPGARPSPPVVRCDEIPYTVKKLAQGEAVSFRSLEDLPPGETVDRTFFGNISVDRLFLVPSTCGTRDEGLLGIACSADHDWLNDSLNHFKLLANLIASTLERYEAEKEKLESDLRFQALFREAPIGIALEDADGHLLFPNPALCSMLGYSEEELRSMSCSEFDDPEFSNEERRFFQQLQAGLIAGYHLEKRYTRRDGTQIWGHLSVSMLNPQGGSSRLVIAMVQDITERKAVEAGLLERDAELQKLTRVLIQAQEDERQRISRELHDDIGQRLALLTVGLTRLGQELPVSIFDKQKRLFDLVADADELSTDVHELSHQLHSSTLQHLGLKAALKGLCKKAQRQHNVAIHLEADDIANLPSEVALCFFRVAQEALSNAVNHGGAKHISLRLRENKNVLQLQVNDSGVGFDLSSSRHGLGLVTMRERLRMLGGELIVRSSTGHGTEVTAELRMAA